MNIKRKIPLFLVLVMFVAGAGLQHALAQSVTLTISPTTISFPAADPDAMPLINADFPVHVRMVISGTTRSWRLTLRANGDLSRGSGQNIPISNVSWTATPVPPFQNGTLANGVSQQAASGSGSGTVEGDLSFTFRNYWTYRAGSYTQTVRVTLSII